jgi:hypothetical protein
LSDLNPRFHFQARIRSGKHVLTQGVEPKVGTFDIVTDEMLKYFIRWEGDRASYVW